MIFLCLWTIRTRRSLNNGTTTSTNGTSVETISVQSSPPESPVMSPQRLGHHRVCSCLKRRFVSASTKRRHMNVTPTVPQETLVSCLHRSHQLLPGSNAVPLYLTCLDCRHHAKWTHRTGPTFQQFPELQRMVQALQRTTRMMCLYLLMAGINVLSGPSCALRRMERMLVRPNSSSVDTFHVDSWNSRDSRSSVFREDFRETVLTCCSFGGQVTNPEDRDTAVRLRGHRLATVSDRSRWQAKLEES